MMELKVIACVFLMMFLNIATIDGLYLHLYKYRLYAREESKREHLLHSLNAFLFPWSVYFIFLDQFKGIYLWIGVLLSFVSLLIEFFDLFEEKQSRESLGGLTSFETLLHFAMGSLRASYTTLILVSKSASDWLLENKNIENESSPILIQYFIYTVVIACLFVCALHFTLMFHQRHIPKDIKVHQ